MSCFRNRFKYWSSNISLQEACEHGTVQQIKNSIKKGEDINQIFESGDNALHVTCENQREEKIIKYLLKHMSPQSLTLENYYGYTPLDTAVDTCSLATIQLVLKHGSFVESKRTILHFACIKGKRYDVIKHMIKIIPPAHINQRDNQGFTPIYHAIEYCSPEVIELMIKNKADVNREYPDLRGHYSGNLLHVACRAKRPAPVFDCLLRYMDTRLINEAAGKYGHTPLLLAARYCSVEVVELLIKHGADVNYTSPLQQTPLGEAVTQNLDASICLMKAGAKKLSSVRNLGTIAMFPALELYLTVVSEDEIINGQIQPLQNVFTELCDDKRLEHLQIVLKLIARWSHKVELSQKLLYCSSKDGVVEVVRYLLEQKHSDINWCDGEGRTALLVCSLEEEILNLLLENRADIFHCDTNGRNILHYACHFAQPETIQFLINKGADVNVTDLHGNSPVSEALANERFDVVNILLKAGALRKLNSDITMSHFSRNNQMKILFLLLEDNINISTLSEAHQENDQFLLFSLWATAPDYIPSNQSFLRICQLSPAAYHMFFCNHPLLPINEYEKYLHLAMTSNYQQNRGFHILSTLRKEFPTLTSFCRASIRLYLGELFNNFGEEFSILSVIPTQFQLPIEQRILTDVMIRYIFMHEEAISVFPDWTERIDEFFYVQSGKYKSPVHNHTDPLPESLKDKVDVLANKCSRLPQTERPDWILADMGGSCLQDAQRRRTNVTNHIVNLDEIISVKLEEITCDRLTVHTAVSRLYRTFLELLSSREGITWSLLPTGSYHHNTKVGGFTEIDFVAEMTDVVFQITAEADPFQHKVTIPLHMQQHLPILMKNYLHQGLRTYLKDVITQANNPPAKVNVKHVNNQSTNVAVKLCYPYKFSPAVCTVLEWWCRNNHKHELSVDITPAIPFKTLGEIHSDIPGLDKEPFKAAREDILATKIHLVPMKDPHYDITNGTTTSTWQVSYFATTDLIFKCLDRLSVNIKLCYRTMKYIRDILFPYAVKYSPYSLIDENFIESQMISSHALYNILLEEVVRHPTSVSWREENIDLRIMSMLTAVKKWRYTAFFTQDHVQILKLYGLGSAQKEAMMTCLGEDIDLVISYLSGDIGDLSALLVFDVDADEYKDKVCLISTNQAPYSHIRLMVDTMYRLRFHGASVRRQIQAAETEDLYYYKVVSVPDTELTRFLQMLILEKFTLAR